MSPLGPVQSCAWHEARSADGPALAKVLDRIIAARGVSPELYGETFARVLRAWREEGRCSDFYTVDRHLNRLGLLPQDLPEHVWSRRSPHNLTGLRRGVN